MLQGLVSWMGFLPPLRLLHSNRHGRITESRCYSWVVCQERRPSFGSCRYAREKVSPRNGARDRKLIITNVLFLDFRTQKDEGAILLCREEEDASLVW